VRFAPPLLCPLLLPLECFARSSSFSVSDEAVRFAGEGELGVA
jgi:hypothetical protein